MEKATIIAWTDSTANFWMGCSKVSEGCMNCYAEKLTKNRMGLALWGVGSKRQEVKSVEAKIRIESVSTVKGIPGVMGSGNPRLVFIGSLMDWAEDHPQLNAYRSRMWQMIRKYPNLIYQLLTKRPENIRKYLPCDWGEGYKNIWLGVSIENMKYAYRADELRKIPATIRFISYEPALGSLNDLNISGIDWIIYGGESGPGYRDHDINWAREMQKKCDAAKIPFFFKQSSAIWTEMGTMLDGKTIRLYPTIKPQS